MKDNGGWVDVVVAGEQKGHHSGWGDLRDSNRQSLYESDRSQLFLSVTLAHVTDGFAGLPVELSLNGQICYSSLMEYLSMSQCWSAILLALREVQHLSWGFWGHSRKKTPLWDSS